MNTLIFITGKCKHREKEVKSIRTVDNDVKFGELFQYFRDANCGCFDSVLNLIEVSCSVRDTTDDWIPVDSTDATVSQVAELLGFKRLRMVAQPDNSAPASSEPDAATSICTSTSDNALVPVRAQTNAFDILMAPKRLVPQKRRSR